MGEISNTIKHYFADNRRFADIFNGVCFQGKIVVRPEDLSDASEIYHEPVAENMQVGVHGKRTERIRDICKRLKTGETLRILALENQEWIDYAMPFRCMQYDAMEYARQLDHLQQKNRWEGKLRTQSERICGLQRKDYIIPVYTLFLYHGTKEWDGPRSLRDMMRFGEGKGYFHELFSDYPLHLYCLNEANDLKLFHTEVRILFQALKYRGDKAGLKRLIQNDPEYQRLDMDTLEVMSVMLEIPDIWSHREKYVDKNNGRQEEYNMCQAIREWAEEERSIGREEGYIQCEHEKTFTIVNNMLQRGMSDQDIMAIAECGQEVIDRIRNSK